LLRPSQHLEAGNHIELIVLAADYLQRQSYALVPLCAAGSYSLLVTNTLYLNQSPDRTADADIPGTQGLRDNRRVG
jgi:hypothetical protein